MRTVHAAIVESVRVSGIELRYQGTEARHVCILNPKYPIERMHVYSTDDLPSRWMASGPCTCVSLAPDNTRDTDANKQLTRTA